MGRLENQEIAMHEEMIDLLTRAVAAPDGGRMGWRALASLVAAGVWDMMSRSAAQAQVMPSDYDPSCDQVDLDGFCPSGTYKREQPDDLPPLPTGCETAVSAKTKVKGNFGKAKFTAACNARKSCYTSCVKIQANCDGSFDADMFDACEAAYPGDPNRTKRRLCFERAIAYSNAIGRSSKGSWETAQITHCECCKIKVYCACNKKCYDNGSDCTSECHASLACNTGICAPATPQQCPPA